MGKRNFNGVQINQSVTIVEKAGTDITDCRNRAVVFDENGNVVLGTDGSKPIAGITLIETGMNDISGVDAGKVRSGDDVDIQIKDIGYILAGAEIAKGAEVTSGADGTGVTAEAGDYVIGTALSAASKDDYCRIQITKYWKAGQEQKKNEEEVNQNG